MSFLTGVRPPSIARTSRRGEILEVVEKLKIGILPQSPDGTWKQAPKFLNDKSKPECELTEIPHIESLESLLRDGNLDLMAISSNKWEECNKQGLVVLGSLSRREPTWILISEDKPEYLQKGAVVIIDHPLLVRQMRRVRNDLDIRNSEWLENQEEAPEMMDNKSQWLDECRKSGLIDGFIAQRGAYDLIYPRPRRHTLGIQRDEPTRERFIPPPMGGFTLLVARVGFPINELVELIDEASSLSYRLEKSVFDSLPNQLKDITGLIIEQRKIGTLIRQAKGNDDEHILESVLDPYKKPNNSAKRVEMMIETLNPNGNRTASCERLSTIEDSSMAIIRLLQEWNILIESMTSEHEESARRFPQLSDEENEQFMSAQPAMMNLFESDEN